MSDVILLLQDVLDPIPRPSLDLRVEILGMIVRRGERAPEAVAVTTHCEQLQRASLVGIDPSLSLDARV